MSGMVGGDLQQLDSLATVLSTASTSEAELRSNVDTAVANTAWVGTYADRFRAVVESELTPAMTSLETALAELQDIVTKNKTAIAQATGSG